MFPIHFKLTISTPAELAAITQFVAAGYATNVANAPTVGVSADEKAAVVGNVKPAAEKTAAKPANAKLTATEAPAPAAAEKKGDSASGTTQPAGASSAFEYKTLQALVLKLLKTHADELSEIAKKHGQPHGATTFKTLPPECWPAAYADVQALEVAGV